MAFIESPDTDYTIRCIRKETSCINKNSDIYDMRDSLHMPMRAVTISMFYVICLCILQHALTKSVL